MSVSLRVEFTNLLNRTEMNDPTATNPQLAQTRVNTADSKSQTVSGFGFINALGTTFSAPRQGQIIARFQF